VTTQQDALDALRSFDAAFEAAILLATTADEKKRLASVYLRGLDAVIAAGKHAITKMKELAKELP
jgi:hypothetical protein